MKVAWIMLLLCASPPSALAIGVLPVIENGQPKDCAPLMLCPASYDLNDARDVEIDLTQDLSSNGVVVASPIAQMLLPDGALFLRGDEIALPNPVSPALTGFGGVNTSSVLSGPYVFVFFSEDGTTYGYYGPTSGNSTFAHREALIPYSQGERGVFHDRIIPPNPGTTSTDEQISGMTATCAELPDRVVEDCDEELSAATQRASAVAPNIFYGLTWESAGIADSMATFTAQHELSTATRARSADESEGGAAHGSGQPLPTHTTGSPRFVPSATPRRLLEDGGIDSREPFAAGDLIRIAKVLAQPPEQGGDLLVVAASGAFVLALVIKLLYARIRSRQEALALAGRQRLVDTLAQRGPLTVTDLARSLSVDRSTALYHIRILPRSSSVQVTQVGRLVYILLPGQTPPALPPSSADGAADVLLSVLRTAGGALARADLHALASSVPQRQRNEVLRKLTDQGIVERAFVGNAEVVRITRPGAFRRG